MVVRSMAKNVSFGRALRPAHIAVTGLERAAHKMRWDARRGFEWHLARLFAIIFAPDFNVPPSA
jgi:hypothetical protein